jgi:hypothetical protein
MHLGRTATLPLPGVLSFAVRHMTFFFAFLSI